MSSRGSSTSEPPAMNDSPEIDGKVEIASKIAVVCGRSADGAESLKEPVRNYLKGNYSRHSVFMIPACTRDVHGRLAH